MQECLPAHLSVLPGASKMADADAPSLEQLAEFFEQPEAVMHLCRTNERGQLIANQDIPAGTIVGEYVGDAIYLGHLIQVFAGKSNDGVAKADVITYHHSPELILGILPVYEKNHWTKHACRSIYETTTDMKQDARNCETYSFIRTPRSMGCISYFFKQVYNMKPIAVASSGKLHIILVACQKIDQNQLFIMKSTATQYFQVMEAYASSQHIIKSG